MKRPKKATIEFHNWDVHPCVVTCPHCGVELRGDLAPAVLMVSCLVCGNPIDFRVKDKKPVYVCDLA